MMVRLFVRFDRLTQVVYTIDHCKRIANKEQ